MFTGIITDIGTVKSVTRGTGGEWGDTRMDIECAYDTSTIDIGASISHAGACMTVIEKGPGWYAFEVSDESLDKTTMRQWKAGTKINLERALTGADELGGHLVTGHVDGVGTLAARTEIAGSLKLDFEAPDHIAFGIAPKGSITVDGVSLTVNEASGSTFSVNIIPPRYVARYLAHMGQKS